MTVSINGVATTGDMLKSVYDSNLDSVIALAQLDTTVCSETEAEAIAAAAPIYHSATLAQFQANPGTGDCADPDNINDNNDVSSLLFSVVNQYAEVDFGMLVKIKRWRMYGATGSDPGNRWKIQYYNVVTLAWVDWVTDIVDLDAYMWSDFSTETEIVTDKIRFVLTTRVADGMIRELEVIF